MYEPYFIEFETDQYHMIVNLDKVMLVSTKNHNYTIYVELTNGKPIMLSSSYPVGEMIMRNYKEWLCNIGKEGTCQNFDFTAWLDECEEIFENAESNEQDKI